MKIVEEIFGKHFNGLHYNDITNESIIKFAEDYAMIYHNIEVKKLHMQSVTVPIGKGCDSPCCRNLATHTVITPNEYYCDEHNSL